MDYHDIKRQLIDKRRELVGRLEKLARDVHHREEPYEADFAEQAIELQNLDVLFELDEESRHELNQINNALNRIENHEYESCAVCGEAIGAPRLQALPYADTCIVCAEKQTRRPH